MKAVNNDNKEARARAGWELILKSINPSDIEVIANGYTVILKGKVDSYLKKRIAEKIICGTYGLKAIKNELLVCSDASGHKADSEMRQTLLNAFVESSYQPKLKTSLVTRREILPFYETVQKVNEELFPLSLSHSHLLMASNQSAEPMIQPALIEKQIKHENFYWEVFG